MRASPSGVERSEEASCYFGRASQTRPPPGAASGFSVWQAAIALILTIACGCSTDNSADHFSYVPPQTEQEKEIKATDVALDRDRIMVQSGNLALPYQQLGPLAYTEPFSPRAIDEDHIDDRLRTMAIAKWGNDVDAIVGVKTALSRDAREVNVSAEVVKVTGDCSFCRHAGGYAQGK
ncbi:MAG TPA: hypothetical protein VKS22_16350 [Candidatus Binataceae bacterium]|nr:hypothetical protein [Candidatus Binataceae bacterium]